MKEISNKEIKPNQGRTQVEPKQTNQEIYDEDDESAEETQTDSAETCIEGDTQNVENQLEEVYTEEGEACDSSSGCREELQTGSAETCTEVDTGVENDAEANSSGEHDTENNEANNIDNDDAVIAEIPIEELKKSDEKPNIKSTVQYALKNGQITKSHVLSRQPKKNSKYKDWINVQIVGEEKSSSVNWNDVLWWREVENTEEVLVLSDIQESQQDIINAKDQELQNLINHHVF